MSELAEQVEQVEVVEEPQETEQEEITSTGETEQEVVEEEQPQEITMESLAQTLQVQGEALHKISSRLGRVDKRSLFGNQPQAQQVAPAQQPVVNQFRPQAPQQQPFTQQQQDFSRALVEQYGEEGARPIQQFINQGINQGINQALGPYEGVLNQINEALNASQVASSNLSQLNSVFAGVTTAEVATQMRASGEIDEDDIRVFEANPGLVPFANAVPFYRAALTAKQLSPDKTGQIINNSTKRSKPVLVKGANAKSTLSAEKQLKGKTDSEIAVMLAKNPGLRKQLRKESGLG